MLRYMLDTNICIYTIKNKPAAVRAQFQKHQDHMCISSIVLTELLYGAEKSENPAKSLAVVEGMEGLTVGQAVAKYRAGQGA